MSEVDIVISAIEFVRRTNVSGFVRSACVLSKAPFFSFAPSRPGMVFAVSRIARVTSAPKLAAVRAAAEPTAPVGPKTMTFRAAI